MTTITYPDGTTLTSSGKNRSQIETFLQVLTAQMLGLDTSPANEATWSAVKIGWPTTGQPGPSINIDTVTITCNPTVSDYSQVRDIQNSLGEFGESGFGGAPFGGATGPSLVQTDIFTRCWSAHWYFYGPNAVTNASLIRSGLVKVPFVEMSLASENLYVNPDISEPVSIPENFQGQWWERADLEALFNEQVTEVSTVGTAESVEIIGFTKDGPFTDSTAQLP